MGAEPTTGAHRALAEGRWDDARAAFVADLAAAETPEALFGLAMALWWLGENHDCVERCSRSYALFRKKGDAEGAARCAVWLAITYKANFANFSAANGWLNRAERLVGGMAPGSLRGWVWVARGYRMADLDTAADLTGRAAEAARAAGDVDLELIALSQLGLIRVGQGDVDEGFGLIDEALAAALAGERSTLDTVVYTCCDMLNACDLASDVERAAQWCQIADAFASRFGCPFLYAECRIHYGSVLTATGRWNDAEQQLRAGLRLTQDACPGLHRLARARLAGLRARQGRLEEAGQLLAGLGAGIESQAEVTLLTASLALARGDAGTAERLLEQRVAHLERERWHLASALELLVDAHVAAGSLGAAIAAADRLEATATATHSKRMHALAAGARGRVLIASGDARGAADLEVALEGWSSLGLPLESARTRLDLARALAADEPDVSIDHARLALTTFSELGASIDADRAAAFLRAAGVVPRIGPKRVGLLTMREREVLRLLGAGLSNPEIAARLHVSRKTAAHHVSNVLAKLGLRNRAEAAAQATAVLGDSGVAASPVA